VLDSNYIKRDYKLLREEVNKQSKKLYKNGSTKLSDPDSSGGDCLAGTGPSGGTDEM
jgi:hypothetical protein